MAKRYASERRRPNSGTKRRIRTSMSRNIVSRGSSHILFSVNFGKFCENKNLAMTSFYILVKTLKTNTDEINNSVDAIKPVADDITPARKKRKMANFKHLSIIFENGILQDDVKNENVQENIRF